MKVLTILGTRPEIIRLSQIIPKLDDLAEHILVHTGQNFDPKLTDIFFSELGIRSPDYHLDCRAESAMGQIGRILESTDQVLEDVKPDRILVLGDTNSALSAIAAKRRGIKVFHMEAGNRCYDDRVPEEVNRRLVDHSSDVLMPYTERSRANLLQEGIEGKRIYVTGNPIFEVIRHYETQSENSKILEALNIEPHRYFLLTLHRAENVDIPLRLENFIQAIYHLADQYEFTVICSLHPRTKSQLIRQTKSLDDRKISSIEPVGFFDFIKLEKNAFCVLSDSGTVQEECAIFGVPNVTLRDVTERPEVLEAGSACITGCDAESIARAVRTATNLSSDWQVPPEYAVQNVSTIVTKLILGYW